MLFEHTRTLAAAAATDPDPRGTAAVIGSIDDGTLCEMKRSVHGTDAPVSRIVLALDGTIGESCQVEIWTLVERHSDVSDPTAQAVKQARKWLNATPAAPIIVQANKLTDFIGVLPGPGKLYVRNIVGPTSGGILMVAFL